MSKKGPSKDVTKEMLMEMYHGNADTSLQEVADQLEVSRETVKRWCTLFSIPIKSKSRYSGKRLIDRRLSDKSWLENELATKSQKAIARELNVKPDVIYYWTRRHGLQDLNVSNAVKKGLQKAFPEGRRGARGANWQGGRYVIRSGYVRVNAPEGHPGAKSGSIFEHRLVMEQKLGRYLERHEIVHHIDGDKQNNHPDNLELKTNGEHIREHFEASHEVKGWRKFANEQDERITALEEMVMQLKQELLELRERSK